LLQLPALFSQESNIKAHKSLKPMPPLNFGSYTLSHFINAVFLSSPFYFHQKFRTILVISSHKLFGSRKQLMVCAGSTCATALMIISLPALDNSLFPT